MFTVTKLTDTQWLVWMDKVQVGCFTESNNWGPDGYWSKPGSYYGPNAEAKANAWASDQLVSKEERKGLID